MNNQTKTIPKFESRERAARLKFTHFSPSTVASAIFTLYCNRINQSMTKVARIGGIIGTIALRAGFSVRGVRKEAHQSPQTQDAN